MMICLTVLPLQQLLGAGQYKYRFSILRKLGVEDNHMLVLKLAYIGFVTLMKQIGMTTGIFSLLLICYFIIRWLLFKKAFNNIINTGKQNYQHLPKMRGTSK